MGPLVEELIVDDAVLIAAPDAVEGHLEILVVDGDLVVGELRVGADAEAPGPPALVDQGQIPQLRPLPPGDKQRLGRPYAPAAALVYRVAQPVAAPVIPQIPPAGLPGDAPVFPRLVVPEIEVVPRPVHGDPVGPEAGDPVVLGAPAEEVAPGGVVDHGAQLLHPQIVGPGDGHVHPVDDIFPLLLVKVSILHGSCPPQMI